MTLILHRKHKMRYRQITAFICLWILQTASSQTLNNKINSISNFNYCQKTAYSSFQCNCHNLMVNCSMKNIKNILTTESSELSSSFSSPSASLFIKYLPIETTEILDLSNNRITKNSQFDFSSFQNLRILKISNNKIEVTRSKQVNFKINPFLKQL